MLPLLKRSASGRIANVSTGLGSLTHNGDPSWAFAGVRFIGYNASKAALNMLTVQLAAELKDAGIKVNSADPGFTATDLNGQRGNQTIPEGAAAELREMQHTVQLAKQEVERMEANQSPDPRQPPIGDPPLDPDREDDDDDEDEDECVTA
jgi:NAD(P)-dependent dehydrogenase (short-subunit alcohol dehydrogenase family)